MTYYVAFSYIFSMKKVLVIDSGSGGLNILASCIKAGVGGNFLYYSDQKNLPYGNKSRRELIKILSKILEDVAQFFHFEVVLLACNTLTTSTIEHMRKRYPNILFVGTVPATKPAYEMFDKEDVLIMATKRTLDNLDLDGLTIPNLPTLIDENLLSLDNLKTYLFSHLSPYVNKKAVVLGCTHYIAVKNIIQEILPNSKIVDSGEGVAKRMMIVCGEGNYKVQFISSKGDNAIFSAYFRKILNI